MTLCDDGDVFPADTEGMKRPRGLRGRGRSRKQRENEGMGHDEYLTIKRTIDPTDLRFQCTGDAATTVFGTSPRRDWNGRLRTTSRTSVWKP